MKDKAAALSYVAKAVADMEEFIKMVKPALSAANVKPAQTSLLPGGLDKTFE